MWCCCYFVCLQLNQELEGRAVKDIDAFDNILLEILQSDALRMDMESMRDSMLQFLYEQVQQQQEAAEGEGGPTDDNNLADEQR